MKFTSLKTLIIAAAVTLTMPAMAVDFSVTINSLDGTPIKKDAGSELTLEEVVATSLLSSYADEQNLGGADKVRRFNLAKKIHEHQKNPALTDEEIALIKKLIGKAYGPLIVGPAWALIDQSSTK